MYLDLFQLEDLPFRLSPDPAFLYLSKNHARAKAYMESTIWFSDGFVVITGEIGSGKTTLIEAFLAELPKDVVYAQVSQTQVTPVQFLQTLLAQFGFSPFKQRKAELLNTLNNYLIEQYAAGKKLVLIVDEAQNLGYHVLEEIRLLSGVETTKEKVLRIIIAGQPELNTTLDSPMLEQLSQRIRLRFHLSALTKSETRSYVEHRLDIAGAHGRRIFDDDTFSLLYRYSGGIPRLINTLCDTAMLAAFTKEVDKVTVEEVKAAVEELQWVEYSARSDTLLDDSLIRQTDVPDSLGTLRVAFNGETKEEHVVRPGRMVIGRTADNDVQLNSKYVSRHHAQIISSIDHSILEDLNSTNGLYVRSRRVKRHRLTDGDVILIGKHELVYVDERVRAES